MVYLNYVIRDGNKFELFIEENITFDRWMKYHDDEAYDNYKYTSMSKKILKLVQNPENIIILKCNKMNGNDIDLTKFISVEKLECNGDFFGFNMSVEHLIKLLSFRCFNNRYIIVCNLMKSINITYISCSVDYLLNTTGLYGLDKLVKLELSYNQSLKSLKGLSKCISLQILKCDHCKIKNIKELSTLTNLKILNICNNKLKSLKYLSSLINLEKLDCFDNKLVSLHGIENMEKMNTLICGMNNIGSLDPIKKLVNISYFRCDMIYGLTNDIIKLYNNEEFIITDDLLDFDKLYTIINTCKIDELHDYICNKEDVLIKYNYINFINSDYFYENRIKLIEKCREIHRGNKYMIEIRHTDDECSICYDIKFRRYVICKNNHVICQDCFKSLYDKKKCCVCQQLYNDMEINYFMKD